jgi:hypothetical protein
MISFGGCNSRPKRGVEMTIMERLEPLLGGLLTGVAVLWAGKVVYANPALCSLVGVSREEILGVDPVDWFCPEDKGSFKAMLRRRYEGARQKSGHLLRLCTSGGNVIQVELEACLIHGIEAADLILLLRDVSQRALLEERLRQVQKMEAIGQLAAGIAHDFNNLLGAMANYVTLLRAHLSPGSETMDLLGEIQALVERGSDLVRQILIASKMEEAKEPREEELAKVIRPVVKMLRHSLPKRVKVILEERDLPPFRMDAAQIQQVIMNLCINAADAMPQGGEIRIRMESQRIEDPTSWGLQKWQAGTYAVISVSDTGVGIPPEVRHRIFDPFFTTKDERERSGLGLSICYAIVKRHGGFIDVESTPGAGTTFRVYLPMVEGTGETPPREAKISSGKGERILLVEDEDAMRSSTRLLLEALGYKVLVASGGREALEIIARGQEEIDLILLDLGMPGMDGLETYRRLKELRGPMSTVLMTGLPQSQEAREALKEGIKLVLQKPFRVEQLSETLRQALEERGSPKRVDTGGLPE